jgi:alkanesulfonate monooxygenase SsuD/methylene tetrahydromethanopterin reductase-like flavin-dependent oxidoreductase (luciferase family)
MTDLGTVVSDAPVDKRQSPMLSDAHAFKLAVFGVNQRRGTLISSADGTPKATWEDTKAIAQAADRAGIDGLIPLGRWKNMGRDDKQELHRVFETLTWAAGVAAVTERVQVFSTVHTPLVHPVHAAKAMATIDHISGGRFGLNLVAGWNEKEFDVFGLQQREHDVRYEAAEEWLTLIRELWASDEPMDFAGQFYESRGGVSEPAPLQSPEPVIMSAGSSPAGRRFAARNADINFVIVPSIEATPGFVAEARQAADEAGRDVALFSAVVVVCRDTEEEAQAAFHDATQVKGDWRDAGEATASLLGGGADSISVIDRQELELRIMLHSGLPLVGTPEQVVEGMVRLHEAGIGGVAISWVDYLQGIEQFDQQLTPLMVRAGLRSSTEGAPR